MRKAGVDPGKAGHGEGGREEKGMGGSCGKAGHGEGGREEKGRGRSRGRIGQVERFHKRPAEAGFHMIECYSPCL